MSYCASRLPPLSHRAYVALLIKWRSVLRIFTAAPMSLTPARPAPEAPAAEPVGESSPPPSPTGGASPTTPPDSQPKQTEPEQADPQPKQAEPEPNLGTRTQSQSRRRRLGRAEKGKAAASTLAVDYSGGRGPNGCWMAQYPDGSYRPVLRDAPDASPCDGDAASSTSEGREWGYVPEAPLLEKRKKEISHGYASLTQMPGFHRRVFARMTHHYDADGKPCDFASAWRREGARCVGRTFKVTYEVFEDWEDSDGDRDSD